MDPVRAVTRLTAMMDVLELPQDRPLLTVGSRAVVHVHAVTSDCEILQISQVTNLSTGEVEQKPRHVRANHRARFTLSLFKALPVDEYCEGRGRLSLLAMRTDGRTIAVGRAMEVS
uniref:GTP-eEF1A C-terminal domain-containing protein n=1 Tax=Alexandrium catenella TaxID=2925 RepID=A0A7S1LNI0_ALECA